MCEQSDHVSIEELITYQTTTASYTLQQITNETDLRKLHIFFQVYMGQIKAGVKDKSDFSLDFLINHVNDSNIDETCGVLKSALQVQVTNDTCIQLLNKYSNFDIQPISLTTLKIIKTLLEIEYPRNDLLNTLLSYHLNDSEYKYLISNMLPLFLKNDSNTLNYIWSKCVEEKSLMLITSMPSQYLFSQEWLNILCTDPFWQLLAVGLSENEGFNYKAAVYLFRSSLDVLVKQEACKLNEYYIESLSLRPLSKSYDNFFILLDVSCEKQLHLIEPSLHLLTKLNLPTIWLDIIYKKFLCHTHNAVAYYAVSYFMKTALSNPKLNFSNLFEALNKNDVSILSKRVFLGLQTFCSGLEIDIYENFISNSLGINWNPVAFYNFYKNTLVRPLDLDIVLSIIKNVTKLPHKYIRNGIMFLIFNFVKNDIKEKVSIEKYMNIILEFMLDEPFYRYATKLINLSNLIVPDDFITKLCGFLKDGDSVNIRLKVDFLIEITERKDVPNSLVKNLYHDFKNRKYCTLVMDRLSYLYLVKATDLQQYLLERLDSDEDSYSIRQMDKPSYDLISKSINVLCSNKSANQQLLAFEILFYMTKSNYMHVYNHWWNKILTEKQRIPPNLALNFVNLLLKLPSSFGKKNFGKLLAVYTEFFNCQSDNVLVRIYRNFDFILENITYENIAFLEVAMSKLYYLKARDDVETSVRYFVRSIALNYKTIDRKVLEYLLAKLYQAAGCSTLGDIVIYYCTMYFKYLNFDMGVFPMYEFLLYPNVILNKNERAEYEICTEVYMDLHVTSPYFRAAEIRKWALEDIIFDSNREKITQSVHFLLAHYRKTFNKRYFPDSNLHLHKLRTIQVFIFMLPSISPMLPIKETLITFLIESFTQESHQPSVRLLMQYLLTQLLKEEQNALERLLNALEISSKTHTSTITGFLPVIYALDLIKNQSEFSHRVIEAVMVWTMGPHFKLRYYTQKLIREVCHRHQHNFKFKKYEAIYKAVDASIKATISQDDLDFDMVDYINKVKPWKDPKKLIYIITVHIPEVCSVAACEWEYFKIKQFWSNYSRENLKTEANISNLDLERLSLEATHDNIQKKIVPWQDIFEREDKTPKRGKLILVTSLIESPANLGGLSRTCEIFGGYMLVVDNIAVAQKKEFTNLSMTSEKWLNITEVKVPNLPNFLNKCKENRYKVVGIEQTSESTSIDSYHFKENTVILLGNEKTGIPAPLIGLMDDCVEIPQFGIIRSLNVHVAGALAVWEYTKQRIINPK